MDQGHCSRRFLVRRAVGAAGVCLAVSLGLAEPPPEPWPGPAVYDRDPQHLWNRLYEVLCVRVGPDGQSYGSDRFEPLLWLGSRHLLQGPSAEQGAKLLDQFLDQKGERLIDDPLKRALLQRDLWMLYSWLEGSHSFGGGSGVPPEKLGEAKKRLGLRLATVIRRLALSPAQIQKLPDNYADAAKSSCLPDDLFSADGPWVCVGRSDGPVAQMHVQEANTLANSAFLIFLRLPGGRAATLKYLERDTGDLPAGSQAALVRVALLIAAPAEITPTKLVESIQLRVYGETELSVSEFRLSRILLLAGRAGGLRAVGDGERDFKTGFAGPNGDPFEEPPPVGQDFKLLQVDVKAECQGCHGRERFPGIRAPRPLVEVPAAAAMETAVKWKRERADWKALRKLLAE